MGAIVYSCEERLSTKHLFCSFVRSFDWLAYLSYKIRYIRIIDALNDTISDVSVILASIM